MPKLIEPNLQRRFVTEVLRELSAGTGRSSIIDLAHYPQGSLQIWGGAGGDAPSGLAGTVQVSNIPDGAWVDFASFTHANLGSVAGPAPGGSGGYVLLPVGPRYACVNVTALAGGLVGAVIHVPGQS